MAKRRNRDRGAIASAIGEDLGELLIADAESRETQDHLAAVLEYWGWRCKPPQKGKG